MPMPRYNHGYPCVDGWLRQCEQYFKELEGKSDQLQSYLQGVLCVDAPAEPLDRFVQQWVHVLSRLATRGLSDDNFSDHFRTRVCVIKETNEFNLTHEVHPDIFIHSNVLKRVNKKEYRAYLLVQCNSQSFGSRDLCNQCVDDVEKIGHDCGGSGTSFFMAKVFGLLHARYIAMPTYDTPVAKVEDIDLPYLKYFLEQHTAHGNPVIDALVVSLKTLIDSWRVAIPSTLQIEFRPEEQRYLDSQSLNALPEALRVVHE